MAIRLEERKTASKARLKRQQQDATIGERQRNRKSVLDSSNDTTTKTICRIKLLVVHGLRQGTLAADNIIAEINARLQLGCSKTGDSFEDNSSEPSRKRDRATAHSQGSRLEDHVSITPDTVTALVSFHFFICDANVVHRTRSAV